MLGVNIIRAAAVDDGDAADDEDEDDWLSADILPAAAQIISSQPASCMSGPLRRVIADFSL